MLKSPEEYLSELSFEPPEGFGRSLTSGEKIFIEKYLGLEAFENMPEIFPEENAFSVENFTSAPFGENPAPLQEEQEGMPANDELIANITELENDRIEPAAAQPDAELSASSPITRIPEPVMQIAPESAIPATETLLKEQPAQPVFTIATPEKVKEDSLPTEPPAAGWQKEIIADAMPAEISAKPSAEEETEVRTAARAAAQEATEIAPVEKAFTQNAATPAANVIAPKVEAAYTSLREKLKEEQEIQMVSFFTAGQRFLLPVMSIQEVLRHQELIKVPQAPQFVAGVINLRGHVMPIVHLSALLTSASEHPYSKRNFIIVCGTEQFRMGLIIDRISSMHVLPQNSLIWNVESKLGDSAEFLCAIANLEDKVCGIVEPDAIAQKILEA